MKKQKPIFSILIIILFVSGVFVFTYPMVSDSINNYYDQKMLRNYYDTLDITAKDIEKFRNQNKEITNNPGIGLTEDPFEMIKNRSYNAEEIQKHLIGSIVIPSVQIELPIFDETNASLLELGATLLPGTSYPVGGLDTHAVITSHSGFPKKTLFTDLEKLKMDEYFYIKNNQEVLAYRIFEIREVMPYETETLLIREGHDIVTLVTCTPYMVNTHRLLVTGERVEIENTETLKQTLETVSGHHRKRAPRLIITIATMLIMSCLLWWHLIYKLQRGAKS